MKEIYPLSEVIKHSIQLSRQELQNHQLLPGDIVRHDMFEADLTVTEHIDSLVHVESLNPYNGRRETAVLPMSELYYPDLAAGALILQLEP